MAKRGRKANSAVEKTIKMTANDFKGAIEEASRLKEQSSSYSGYHGQHVKAFIEKTGYSRTAFNFIRKLHDLGDDLKRQSLMREIMMGFDLMGWANQRDLLDDVKEEISKRVAPSDDDDKDLRPPFLRDAMPLDKAQERFEENNKKTRKRDALSELAGDGDHPSTH